MNEPLSVDYQLPAFEIGQKVLCYGKWVGVVVDPHMKLPPDWWAVYIPGLTGYGGFGSSLVSTVMGIEAYAGEQEIETAQAPVQLSLWEVQNG